MSSDQQAIQGMWRVVAFAVPSLDYVDHDHDAFWEIKGDRIRLFRIGGDAIDPRFAYFSFVLDPTVTPKRIERTWERVKPDGEVLYTVLRCWYELKGDVLRIAGSGVLNEYPTGRFEQATNSATLERYSGSFSAEQAESAR